MAQTKSFTDEQNAAVRAFVVGVLADRFGNNQSRAARAIGVQQGSLNEFLNGRRGAGMKLIVGVSKAVGVPVSAVLGESVADAEAAEVSDQFPARAEAIRAWKKPMEQAVESVASMRFKGAEELTVEGWLNYLDTAAKSFRSGHANDPRKLPGVRIATSDDD